MEHVFCQTNLPASKKVAPRIFLPLASTIPFLGAYIYFFLLSGTAVAMVAYAGVKLFTLLFPIAIVYWIDKRHLPVPSRKFLRFSDLVQGLLSGMTISLVMATLFVYTPLGDIVLTGRGQIVDRVAGLGVLHFYIPFAIFLSLAHSLLEEYYWRWFVFGHMDQVCPGKAAHALAALAFGLHHYVILTAFFGLPFALFTGTLVALGGAIWSWQFRHTGNLVSSWISHIIVDAAILTVGYFIILG